MLVTSQGIAGIHVCLKKQRKNIPLYGCNGIGVNYVHGFSPLSKV